ncbi:hypothetical protein ACTQ49_02330 [Luteococcus sp. Sow4_B9]|uniref:hypothetical protein n=1 Tax=Luteococcus sp. Sow4_B9 TaxID=3438792 RepID=UPI003F95066A
MKAFGKLAATTVALGFLAAPLAAGNAQAALDPDGTQRQGMCYTKVQFETDGYTSTQLRYNMARVANKAYNAGLSVTEVDPTTGTMKAMHTYDQTWVATGVFSDYRVEEILEQDCFAVIQTRP